MIGRGKASRLMERIPEIDGELRDLLKTQSIESWALLNELVSTSAWRRIGHVGKAGRTGIVGRALADIKGLEYSVFSYWSPLDRRRHSLAYRRQRGRIPKEAAAAATLFYALTYAGETKGLFSLVHYLGSNESLRPAIGTRFNAAPKRGYHIRISRLVSARLLSEIGWSDQLRTFGRLPHKVLSGYATAMMSEGRIPSDTPLEILAEHLVSDFSRSMTRVSASVGTELASLRGQINEQCPQLSPMQANFVVATQLLWRMACPCQYMNALPFYVSTTSCVLSIGSSEPLDDRTLLALSVLARSLFSQLTVRDFAQLALQEESASIGEALRRFIAHRLPKVLIRPAMHEIDNALRHTARVPQAERSLSTVRRLLLHYEKLLNALMPGDELKQFNQSIKPIDISSLLDQECRFALDLGRERHMSDVKDRITVSIDCPANLRVQCHKEYFAEMAFNFVLNAIDALSPPKIRSSSDAGVITVLAYAQSINGFHQVTLEVSDKGIGIGRRGLDDLTAVFTMIEGLPREDLSKAMELLLERLRSESKEDHLNVGLSHTALYLRALEWHPSLKRPGRVRIASEAGKGTTITATVPVVLERNSNRD